MLPLAGRAYSGLAIGTGDGEGGQSVADAGETAASCDSYFDVNPFAGRRECGECEKYRVLGNEYRTG